jgi:hypothetical protein
MYKLETSISARANYLSFCFDLASMWIADYVRAGGTMLDVEFIVQDLWTEELQRQVDDLEMGKQLLESAVVILNGLRRKES